MCIRVKWHCATRNASPASRTALLDRYILSQKFSDTATVPWLVTSHVTSIVPPAVTSAGSRTMFSGIRSFPCAEAVVDVVDVVLVLVGATAVLDEVAVVPTSTS